MPLSCMWLLDDFLTPWESSPNSYHGLWGPDEPAPAYFPSPSWGRSAFHSVHHTLLCSWATLGCFLYQWYCRPPFCCPNSRVPAQISFPDAPGLVANLSPSWVPLYLFSSYAVYTCDLLFSVCLLSWTLSSLNVGTVSVLHSLPLNFNFPLEKKCLVQRKWNPKSTFFGVLT